MVWELAAASTLIENGIPVLGGADLFSTAEHNIYRIGPVFKIAHPGFGIDFFQSSGRLMIRIHRGRMQRNPIFHRKPRLFNPQFRGVVAMNTLGNIDLNSELL